MPTKTTRRGPIDNDLEFFAEADTVASLKVSLDATRADLAKALEAANEEWGGAIKSLEAEIKAGEKRCETYAKKHRKRLLGGGPEKSTDTALAIFGFRIIPAKLQTIGRHTWKAVTEQLREAGRYNFLRVSYSENREALETLTDSELAELGLKKSASEVFYIKAKAQR